MKFIKVNEVPKRGSQNNLMEFIRNFIDSDFTYARVEYNDMEYKHPESCVSSLSASIKRSKAPCRAITRNKVIYIVRTDRGDYLDLTRNESVKIKKGGKSTRSK